MSAVGMLTTVMATEIAEAVLKDETDEAGGCDISAGLFGPHLSAWIKETAAIIAKTTASSVGEDHVRVLRIVEYIGPRYWVEKTLAGSLQGTKEVGPDRFIRTATVGTYPEILQRPTKEEDTHG